MVIRGSDIYIQRGHKLRFFFWNVAAFLRNAAIRKRRFTEAPLQFVEKHKRCPCSV